MPPESLERQELHRNKFIKEKIALGKVHHCKCGRLLGISYTICGDCEGEIEMKSWKINNKGKLKEKFKHDYFR